MNARHHDRPVVFRRDCSASGVPESIIDMKYAPPPIYQFDTDVWRSILPYMEANHLGNFLLTGDKRMNTVLPAACKSLHVEHCGKQVELARRLAVTRALKVGLTSLTISSCKQGHLGTLPFDPSFYVDLHCLHLAPSLTRLHFVKFVVNGNDSEVYKLPSSVTDLQLGKIILSSQCKRRNKSCIDFSNLKLSVFGADCRGTRLKFQKSIMTFVSRFSCESLVDLSFLSDIPADFEQCNKLERLAFWRHQDIKLPQCAPQKLVIRCAGLQHPMRLNLPNTSYLHLQTLDYPEYESNRMDISIFVNLTVFKIFLVTHLVVAPCEHLKIYTESDVSKLDNHGSGTATVCPRRMSFADVANHLAKAERHTIDFDATKEFVINTNSSQDHSKLWEHALLARSLRYLNLVNARNSRYLYDPAAMDYTPLKKFACLERLRLNLPYSAWLVLEQTNAIPPSVTRLKIEFWDTYSCPQGTIFCFPANVQKLSLKNVQFCIDMLKHLPPQLQSLKIYGQIAMGSTIPPSNVTLDSAASSAWSGPALWSAASAPDGFASWLLKVVATPQPTTCPPMPPSAAIMQYTPPEKPMSIPHVKIVLRGNIVTSDLVAIFCQYLLNATFRYSSNMQGLCKILEVHV